MFDPITQAEQAKEAFALHFMGRYYHKMRDVMDRLQVPAGSPNSRRDEFMKVRGPYLQALQIPEWSDTPWDRFARSVRGSLAPDGLRPEVIQAFGALGFQKLHRFQEETIRRICDDRDTLAVAATGRGKSESWLIPIFHFIVAEKLAGNVKGTKALLLYPTKALAQDQFRRIIGYLLEINRLLPKDRPITVGILDSDTPFAGDENKVSFLNGAFQFMDCPLFDPNRPDCQTCPKQQVAVDPTGDRLVLTVGQERCRREAPLEFVHLTREDVRDGRVDIVLTNPDLLNFQLININSAASRTQLICDPKFIVLDEVHTYSGLFGNFTAALIRRLKLVREAMGEARYDLRFIAASATVANKKEIFQQLCGVADGDCVVTEQPVVLAARGGGLPPGVTECTYSEANLRPAVLTLAGLPAVIATEAAIGEWLLEQIVRTDAPEWDWVRQIYQYMRSESPLPEQLRTFIRTEFGLSSDSAADHVLRNFVSLGSLAGILERRAHLFAWALDGYYKCAHCGRVYASPVSRCECGQTFISRFAFCVHCGEEVVEAWACPACRTLYPMIASRDGETTYFDPPVCECDGHEHLTIRCVIRPHSECSSCGSAVADSYAITCPQCGAWTAAAEGERACVNPECGWHGSLHSHTCDCGNERRTQPIRTLHWVCGGCGARHETNPPARCGCGSRTYFLDALFRVDRVVNDDRGHSFIPGMNPDLAGAVLAECGKQTYQLVDQRWQLREVGAGGDRVAPCTHPGAGWRFQRFNSMVRTPENILATSSQFLLRSLLKDEGRPLTERLKTAKMLTFSDSIRDMEAVNRNFNEPERTHFLEALLYEILRNAGGQLPLDQLTAKTMAAVEEYGALVYGDGARQEIYRDLVPPRTQPRFRKGTLEGMLLDLIRPSRRHFGEPSLVRSGLFDLKPDPSLGVLPAAKQAALGLFWQSHQGRWRQDVLEDSRLDAPVREALRQLFYTDGVLTEERNRLYVKRSLLHVTLVNQNHPANWDPWADRFVSTAELTITERSSQGLVHYAIPLEERAKPGSRYFSPDAYELLYSPAALLVSRVYKGDTPKELRRRIEFEFKTRPSLHHISSGPAMEVGVDIGNLNVMALYGTPPNINAYLQRIGRAGRKSKRALIFTVSKSNPIDYYYHRDPHKLIDSAAQPVPLTTANQEVARIALTWGVLDFIATKYRVPWQRKNVDDIAYFVADDPAVPTVPGDAAKYLRLTNLLYARVDQVNQGESLAVLNDVVTGNFSDLKAWLQCLLGAEMTAAEKESLVEEVLLHFPDNVYGFVGKLLNDLNSQWEQLAEESNQVQRQIMKLKPSDAAQRAVLTRRRAVLLEQSQAILTLQDGLQKQRLVDVQQMTEAKRYAYSLRSVSNDVTVYLRKGESEEEEAAAGVDLLTARELGLALREYYPAAAVLLEEQPHIVIDLKEAGYATLQLRQQFGDHRWGCENCGALFESEARPGVCHCGEADRIRRLELVVPGKVTIAPATVVLQENPVDGVAKLTAQMIYRTATRDSDVKATYPESTQQALDVDVLDEEIALPGFSLGFAWVDLASFVHAGSAVFDDGRREPPTLLCVCGVPGCGGVIRQGAPSFCVKDPSHDLQRRKYVILGRNFRTRAAVIAADSALPRQERERVAHTLAHGLRVALQHVAGVDVRQLGELRLPDGRYLVYEDVEGGFGIVDLLRRVNGAGERTHLEEAMTIVRQTSDSDCCDEGCPFCLMQYGCGERNRTRSFSKQRVRVMLQEGGGGGGDKSATEGAV
ncbi:MAG TPA: DEAD/DEAH box helicase [Symbiobacteriaceae bacterium]|nr:DEAD/DEAH box helicase [Symbiobacteriaceae bacterium]